LSAGNRHASEAVAGDLVISLNIGVTGHRDLRPQDVATIEAHVRSFYQGLQESFPDLPLQLLTALAEGADQLAARVALSMGIPIVAVLPMEQSDYEKDFGSPEAVAEFRSFLVDAAQVITLPRAPASQAHGDPGGKPARERQYAQLGIFVSNHCQVLLALWDGKPGTALGGTGQVVHYHLTAVMEGFEEETSPATLLAENENDLVYHIVCPRDRPGGEPGARYEAFQTNWFSSLNEGRRSSDMPEVYHTLLASLQQFVRDWHGHRGAIEQFSTSLIEDPPALEIPTAARLTDRLFQIADSLAIYYQKRVNLTLKATYGLAVIMGLVFLVYTEADGDRLLVLAFLALFFGGVLLHKIGERREWHRKYLDYRALAEGLRVQFYWMLAGVVDSSSADFAYDNFLQKQDVDLGWIRHVMRTASLHRDRGKDPDSAWVGWVIEQWIGVPKSGRGQLAYYSRKRWQNVAQLRRTQLLGSMSLWTGIAIAALLFLMGGKDLAGQRQVLLILMGVLPLIAGVWDAYSHKKAEKELIKQYQFMSHVFSKARRLLAASSDIAFHRLVLKALGQAALDEGAEWLLIHRERPLEHSGL
jgi:hypothetical protein